MSDRIINTIGDPIPSNEIHPVSFKLPTWEVVVGLMEDEPWVVSKLRTGYPRFAIHPKVQVLGGGIIKKHGNQGDKILIFPFRDAAVRCKEYIEKYSELPDLSVRIVALSTVDKESNVEICIFAVLFPESEFVIGKQYLRYSGEAISSRMGEYISQCRPLEITQSLHSSPKVFFTESKSIIKKRLASIINDTNSLADVPSPKVNHEDVFLFPTGMTGIFNSHRAFRQIIGEYKSVCYGFPFTDTLKLLTRIGPGIHFYGNGEDEDLEAFEALLESGERIAMLVCEFPSNPLLKSPNIEKIRQLADKYNFAVVIDDTLANFVNLSLFRFADVVCCSLTKIFNGACETMAGSLILNPEGKYYNQLKEFSKGFYDHYWPADADLLEKNSRDVVQRAYKCNENSEAVVELINRSPFIQAVYYPKNSPTRKYYDAVKVKNGGYGSLFSILFKDPKNAQRFYDDLEIAKGPSLGTNFSLCCPFVYLAHYAELEFVNSFGVDKNLVRVSIGLEDKEELLKIFKHALAKCE